MIPTGARPRLRVAAALLLLVLGCARSATGAPAATPSSEGYTVRVGFISTTSTPNNGVEAFAYQQGTLLPALQGIGVKQLVWSAFANGPDLNEAMAGGSIDVGMLGDTPAIVARAAGQPTRSINQTRVGMDAWLMTPKDGPKTLAELAGKTVATQKGSYMHRYLLELLRQNDLADKVTITHMATADGAAALQRGDIAAYAMPITTAVLLADQLPTLDRASDHPGLEGSAVTVATEAFLQQHPEFPGAWNAARSSALGTVRGAPDAYWRFEAQAVQEPVDELELAYPLSNFNDQPLTGSGLAQLEQVKRFLLDQGLAQTDFDLAAWCLAAPGA